MLQMIRSRAGGIVVKGLFGLLILAFGVWGIYTRSPLGDDKSSSDAVVASVGDREIRVDTVQTALQPAIERLRAQLGGSLDPAQVKQLGVVDAVVDQIVERELVDAEVAHLRLDLSDDVIRNAIMSNPAFVGSDGKFNREQFNQVLAANRLTEDGLIARLRQDIPRGDLLQAMTAGVVVPRPMVDAVYRYRYETRVADVVAVPLSAAGTIPAPSEDDLKKYYDAHPDRFRAAEYRGFTLASLSADDLAGDIKVSDDELKSAYTDRKDDFQVPEQREVEQILAPTEDKAKAVEAALAGGEDFHKAAAAIAGQDPATIDLGLIKPEDLPKPLGDAVFSLTLDKPSAPIKDDLGWHILRVVKIVPPQTLSFDQAKDQLEKQLIAEKAADKLDDVANKADDALAGGAALDDVAKKFGLKLTNVASTDEGGRDPDGKPISLPVDGNAVLKTVFGTSANDTSRVTSIEDSAIFAVHVDKVVEPALKPLDAVKDQVTAGWQAEQKAAAVKKIGSELADAVKNGTPLAQAAAAKGLAVTTPPPLPRRPTGTGAVPPALVVKLFAAKIGDTVTADGNDGAYVAQLKQIDIPDKTPEDQVAKLSAELGNAARYDMVSEFADALKKRYPVTIHRDVIDRMF